MITSVPFSAGDGAPHLTDGDLSIIWVFPFAGILLSIAIFPLLFPIFWHHNYGKVSAFWAILFLLPLSFSFFSLCFFFVAGL